jgi:hypothetical protein
MDGEASSPAAPPASRPGRPAGRMDNPLGFPQATVPINQGDRTMRNLTVATALAFAIAATFALASAKAEEMLRSGDKCWMDQHVGNNGWGDCPREQSKRAPKAAKASAQSPSRPRPPAAAAGTNSPTTTGSGGGGRY